jgi:uncharacterized lipoprotein YmbA
MKNSSRAATIIISALMTTALAGCATSAPLRFYVLTATAPTENAGTGNASLRVDRVTIPGELDRTEILRRVTANRLELAEQDRWAAPVDEMIRRVLTENLARRALPNASTSRVISLDISEFMTEPDCSVTLNASWTMNVAGLAGAQPQAPSRGTIQLSVPGGGSCAVSAIPGAMSAALGELSTRLVHGIGPT